MIKQGTFNMFTGTYDLRYLPRYPLGTLTGALTLGVLPVEPIKALRTD